MTIRVAYINGCSMTEGSEIGNKKFGYDESLYGPNTNRANLIKQGHPEQAQFMADNCWPAILSKKMGAESIVNNALGGSCNSRLVRTSMIDVKKLLETYQPQDILVIIGWTGISRYEYMNKDKYDQHVIGYSNPKKNLDKSVRTYVQARDEINDSQLKLSLIDFFKNVTLMQYFLDRHGIPYLFAHGLLESFPYLWGQNAVDDLIADSDFRTLYESFDHQSRWIKGNPSVYRPKPDSYVDFLQQGLLGSFFEYANQNKLPIGNGRHPLEESHWAWADFAYNNLKERKII